MGDKDEEADVWQDCKTANYEVEDNDVLQVIVNV
jgi:hypothetical protein